MNARLPPAVGSLTSAETRALSAFAVIHEPLVRSAMASWLKVLEIRNERGTQISTQQLSPWVEAWEAQGVLVASQSGGYSVAPRLRREIVTALHASGALEPLVATVRAHAPLRGHYSFSLDPRRLAREIALASVLGPSDDLEGALRAYRPRADEPKGELYVQALGLVATRAQLISLGFERAERYLARALELATSQLLELDDALIAFVLETHAMMDERVIALAAYHESLRGRHDRAAALTARAHPECLSARCLDALVRGRHDAARELAVQAVEATRTKKSNRLKGLAAGPLWPWITLVLLTDRQSSRASLLAREQLEIARKRDAARALSHVALSEMEALVRVDAPAREESPWLPYAVDWAELVLLALLTRFRGGSLPAALTTKLAPYRTRASAQGYGWVADELTRLCDANTREGLATLHEVEAPWERTLRSLSVAIEQAATAHESASTADERLAWVLAVAADGTHQLSARIQSRSARGYTSGRQVSWKTLYELARDADWLRPEDRRVTRLIEKVRDYGYSGRETYVLDPQAAAALVGHDSVFADYECRAPIEVVRGEPRIEVGELDGELRVTVVPAACVDRAAVCVPLAGARVAVYSLTSAQLAIARAISERGLVLPSEARERLAQVLERLPLHFAVDSELAFDLDRLPEVPVDGRLRVQLRRVSLGLHARVCVVPLEGGASFAPGTGRAVVLGRSEIDGQPVTVRARRDFDEERRRYDALVEACPSLHGCEVQEGEYRLTELTTCLELLAELRSLGDEVALDWCGGQPLAVVGERGVRDLRLRIGEDAGSWFAEGELAVDEAAKLSFHALLALRSRTRARFVPLDEGRYLALSSELTAALDRAAQLARTENDRVSLHPLALLGGGLADATISGDEATEARLARWREARDLQPEIPKALRATLRPYQRDGFVWLSRLAHAGAGACLADDMGLGKTIQALAFLVAQAERGPCLVVAPTSVCANWSEEAERCAPSLRVIRLGGAERARTIEALGPNDLLICSYGVLQQERARLAKKRFRVVVLDEAQAIKNASTQRARAARELASDLRIALTGTPVENHLGELWSILSFLNPGLLGSARTFEERVARPIQREGDRAAAELLRGLVQPFVLRRRKREVLKELPEKTVITLRIEPSSDERALYAALREQALARASGSADDARARMNLLAELTRLRRAACHPALVLPESAIASSKLEALETLLDELREGGHRTLVFSQFVDHLTLVRQRLDARSVSYQYLDGSTPAEARTRAVRAFQAGEGELFLISLRAGGFGLNLTAADYVVHLDPWWNPAVEDQASDRAHRLGQERPVTIYRLVMQDSIEEKILALHAEKRDLADDVLDGTGAARPLDVDELLGLLRGLAPSEPAVARAGESTAHASGS